MSSKTFRQRFNLFKFNTKLWLGGIYFSLFQREYKTEGLSFYIPFDKTSVKFRGQFPINFYERQERSFLKSLLPKDAVVLELGGCLGIVSCIANRLLNDRTKHVVVEANPELIPVLERNKSQNDCGFQIENCMLSRQKENTFYIGKNILTSSKRRKLERLITVPGKTLPELQIEHGLKFDTLIMDIEGGELDFFRENRQAIQQFRIIFMEVHIHPAVLTHKEGEEITEILQKEGFDILVNDSSGFQIWKNKKAG